MFFIKQKTAYEMRISDWSSDVCSSDLHVLLELLAELGGDLRHVGHRFRIVAVDVEDRCLHHLGRVRRIRRRARVGRIGGEADLVVDDDVDGAAGTVAAQLAERRSEEHTSELQSLMRTSYAVFCL